MSDDLEEGEGKGRGRERRPDLFGPSSEAYEGSPKCNTHTIVWGPTSWVIESSGSWLGYLILDHPWPHCNNFQKRLQT